MVKNILEREKRSIKFIFKQVLNIVFGVFLKIDKQIQSAKRNKNMSSRHSPFYRGTILIVKKSRQKCFVVNPKN